MKKIFKFICITIFVVLLTACSKKINKLTYTDYNEYFSNKSNYNIIDNTDKYDISIRRYLEAGEGNVQIFYIEFDNEKTAEKYIKNYYENDKSNKIKVKKNYTYIKNTKEKYMKLYKVDNVIVIGTTNNKKYKREVNKNLRKLGY